MNAATPELGSNHDVICLLFVLHHKVWRRKICTHFGLLIMIVTVSAIADDTAENTNY